MHRYAHQALISISRSWKERSHFSTFWCPQHFTCCAKSVYIIYFPSSKPIAREEKTTQDVNRGELILCGVEWVSGSNKSVSYTSFNKGLHQKFPQHLGNVWEAFLLADRVEKLQENTHQTERTPLHRQHLSALWPQISQKRGGDGKDKTQGRDSTCRIDIMATWPIKLLPHWINSQSWTAKPDAQRVEHRYCGPCCSSATPEQGWHTMPCVAHFIYSGWSRQTLKNQLSTCFPNSHAVTTETKSQTEIHSKPWALPMPSPQASVGCSCAEESFYKGCSKAQ